MNEMRMLGAEDVMVLLSVKKSSAYEVIRQLNEELREKGYLTVRGKVPEKYLRERFYDL
ncbi:hypothetical protein H8S34_00110 [Pseudoflavonifractor sp. NSJ-25]|uniref:Transcriptional regulator n=2 Tax=Pseudoflavonifractor hominis TaxID=2763059 RepID=A0ABR7HNY2_9FIRM|nr:hypothetical protein [Pseudoflavonifractor hominis]